MLGFTFMAAYEIGGSASPLRWSADLILPLVEACKVIANEVRQMLLRLLEVNSARVQNDVLNRIQESRERLKVEIRKLLHEIGRVAEQAVFRARKIEEEGAPAVGSAIERLDRMKREVSASCQNITCTQ